MKECINHKKFPAGRGYDGNLEECQICYEERADYAEECENLTLNPPPPIPEFFPEPPTIPSAPITRRPRRTRTFQAANTQPTRWTVELRPPLFRRGSLRAEVADLLIRATKEEVIRDLMNRYGYTRAYARRKVNMVQRAIVRGG